MSLTVLILLCLAGLGLIALDILVIPGGILGFIGFGMMVFACIDAYIEFGRPAGHIFVAFTAVTTGAFVYYIFKPGSWNRVSLSEEVTGKMNTEDLNAVKTGDSGKTLTALRPSGNALINGEMIEVTTYEATIPAGTEVRVVEISDNKIYVQTI